MRRRVAASAGDEGEQLTDLGIPADLHGKLLDARDDNELRLALNRPDVARAWKAKKPALSNKSVEVFWLPRDVDYPKLKAQDREKGDDNRVWLVPVNFAPGTHARADSGG